MSAVLAMEDPRTDIDPARLRGALSRFATGVTVVSTVAPDGRLVGLTANSFSSVSLDPPLVSWCLARKSPNLQGFVDAEHHSISVLCEGQQDLAMRFARYHPEKFAEISWSPGIGGVPVLHDALAVFECTKVHVHEAGDHVLFLCEVNRVSGGDCHRQPLLFFRSGFHKLTEPGNEDRT